MTTTVKIKRKSNIRERRNRPRKVKMNFSKVNESVKTNKASTNIVNVIKDTSQTIIDKAKANLFGTSEINTSPKSQLEINVKKNSITSHEKNLIEIPKDTSLQKNDINQTSKSLSTKDKMTSEKNNNNADIFSQISLQNGQRTPPITNYNKFLSDHDIQNKLQETLKILSPSEKMSKLRERAKIIDKTKQRTNSHTHTNKTINQSKSTKTNFDKENKKKTNNCIQNNKTIN